LAGKKDLQETIIKTGINKLSFIPAGSTPPNPSELITSSVMECFMAEIKDRYEDRVIILDSTPMQGTAEAKVLAQYADAIVLIVMANKSPREAILKTVDDLGRNKIVGVVFNGYQRAHKGYYKYYKKYYKNP
jgi:capsular exopolysaccharide synthesis family protein